MSDTYAASRLAEARAASEEAAKVIDNLLITIGYYDFNCVDAACDWLLANEKPEWWLSIGTRDLMERRRAALEAQSK